MAADLWWSVWWPWLLVWLGTVLAVVVAVVVLVVQLSDRRRGTRRPPYLSFYLHDKSVMDLYQYKYQGALEQEVQAKVGSRRRVGADGDVPMVKFGASMERNREEFRKYLEVAEPITVIGIMMDVLADDLVQVDLERLAVVPSRNAPMGRSRIKLSQLGGGAYVLVRGVFRPEPALGSERHTTLLATYGDGASGESAARIRLRCANTGLRDEVPEEQFWARCLGTVQGWDAATGHLVLNPIAIFR
ncbi:hypothetical protein Cs7R123_14490 [Catellatospora sp. TT07R-123]|uniref:hypothetical protein n=1 Tax=Catellatospora sp. TT07R-123 TaxID=2733863 RepID=UPI001B059807|nr:hypothetical protein [Catellatospora sp. TT07R-123]GHJ44107.1 hypothetical protein Cs7R123_14490 [Catellatospora sp. TT07R-123]